MKNHSMILILILILLFQNIIPIASSYGKSSNKIIYVDDDGGADYNKIQNAIDNSSDGDTIFVYTGFYKENINISKNITLIGESKGTTIINGCGKQVIKTNYPGECDISNFTIINGSHGFYIRSYNTNIFNNIIVNNTYGILINDAAHIKIFKNYITAEKWGILVSYYNVNIYNNILDNCGIKISGSGHKISKNNIKDAEISVSANECQNSIITRNNIINENENYVKFKYLNAYFPNKWINNYWSDWIYPFPQHIIVPPRIIEGKVIRWDPFTSEPPKEIDWINFDWFPARKPLEIQIPEVDLIS